MTAPAVIKAAEIRTIASAMSAAGVASWTVRIETPDGRKMVVSAGSPSSVDADQFDDVVYPIK